MPTAALHVPPELKKITSFVRRAEELDRDVTRAESRLVAFYCRQHAVRVGIALSNSAAATKCLGEILTTLEAEKEPMAVFSEPESRLICRNFAMGVFDRADAEDRDGRAGKGTAKTFYAAAVFLEILQHFDEGNDQEEAAGGGEGTTRTEEQQEEDEKRIYAKWKATEILKAIKEGREIVPGGYGEHLNNEEEEDEGDAADQQNGTSSSSKENDAEGVLPPPAPVGLNNPVEEEAEEEGTEVELAHHDPPPSAPPAAAPPAYDEFMPVPPPPAASAPPPPPVPEERPPMPKAPPKKSSWFGKKTTSSSSSSSSKKKKNSAAIADAVELTRFALAALESNDVDLGTTRLQQALEILSS